MLFNEGVGGAALLRRQVFFKLLAVEGSQRSTVIGLLTAPPYSGSD